MEQNKNARLPKQPGISVYVRVIWGQLRSLPVSASAVSAATAHVSAAAESSTGSTTAAISACYRRRASASSSRVAASCSGISATNSTAVSSAARISCVYAIATAIAVSAAIAPAAVEPRTCADEEAAVEPLRPVKAVRGAGVRVVRVIAPIANRGTVDLGGHCDRGANANPYSYLGICRGRERQGQKHSEQNQMHFPHNLLLVLPCPGVPNAGTGAELRFQHLPGFGILYPTGFWLLEQQSGGLVAVSFDRIVHAVRKGKSFMQVFRG